MTETSKRKSLFAKILAVSLALSMGMMTACGGGE